MLGALRAHNLRQQSLAQLAGVKRQTIASCISRLREDGYRIMAEATETSGDPKYILVSEPPGLD